jgi:hypothetical protein
MNDPMQLDLDVGVDDIRDHPPGPGDDPSWQESWAFAWYDPVANASGWHHSSTKYTEGVIDLKSWVCAGGRMVHGFQSWDLPIPAEDHSNRCMGPLRIRSVDPLRSDRIEIRSESLQMSLDTDPLVGPHWYRRKAMDHVTRKKSHWESYNSFRGHLTAEGIDRDVSGFAFLSRSWGPRDLRSLLSFRNLWATFGEDLTIRLLMPVTRDGPQMSGFVVDRDQLLPVRHARLDVTMSSDGANPLGCHGTVWTERGGYRFSGTVGDGHAQTNTHPPAEMYSHGSCIFELGGRLGTGFLQVNELKSPAPWDLTRLNANALSL